MYNIIKQLAEEQGKTVAQVSRESGVSEAVMSMMKKRGGKLSTENAAKVARVLNVTVDRLLGEKEAEE